MSAVRMTRYAARWVLPVEAPPIRDGALLVGPDGRILEVGTGADVSRPETAERIELGEAALMPGLVNAHMHPELSYLRGRLEDLTFPDWIAALLDLKRAVSADVADGIAAARWSCLEALASGITAIGATEDSDAAFHALRESGQRGVVYREVFGPSPDQCDASMAELRTRIARSRPHETALVRLGVSPHAPYTVSDELFAAVAAFARDQDLPIAVHTAEGHAETELVTRGEGVFGARLNARGIATPVRARSTVALLERLGILATGPLLIHCVHVDREDMARIADSGATVVHCPAANARLGHGIAPVVDLRRAGVAVGLGSDSVASNNRIDVLGEARLAQMLQRATHRSADLLPGPELLRMATLDGARALGIDRDVGSLEPGKEADLCAVRLDSVSATPVHDPLAALFHSAASGDVVLTAVRGRILYREGRVPGADVARARADIEAVAERARFRPATAEPRYGRPPSGVPVAGERP